MTNCSPCVCEKPCPPESASGLKGGANSIPSAVILVENRGQEQWLRAHIYGNPQPGDRLYLRRLARRGPWQNRQTLKRMGHPVNPPGASGGNLPRHLVNTAFFNAAGTTGSWTTPGIPVRTEWELDQPNQLIWLMPLNTFRGMYQYLGPPDNRFVMHGSGFGINFKIDFVVARPNRERTLVTYGTPSHTLRIKPFIWTGSVILKWAVNYN